MRKSDVLTYIMVTVFSVFILIKAVQGATGQTILDIKETQEIVHVELETLEATTEPVTTAQTELSAVKLYDVPLSEELQLHIIDVCNGYGVEPVLALAVIERESSYKADAIGDGGASFGLMQIQKKWHQAKMDKLGCKDLLNPYDNVTVGINILAGHMSQGKGIEWALMAYNGGSTYADKQLEQKIISNYAKEVINIAKRLEGVGAHG